MDTEAIKNELSLIAISVSRISKLIQGEETVIPGSTAPPEPPIPGSNPYADTKERVKIISDGYLYAESTMTAPYLQSRYWHILWDIADKMNVQLEIVNACLLEGVPAENAAHYPEGRTVDIRYLLENEENIELINRILASFPVYDKATQYNLWSTMDAEVRVSPEIRDRLHLPWVDQIQTDSEGYHDNHMHVRFAA
jgi:hypothetical protein